MARILVLEDDHILAQTILSILQMEGECSRFRVSIE